MSRFALSNIEGLNNSGTNKRIFKLLENGSSDFDSFWEKMEKAANHKKALEKIQTFLSLLEEGLSVPGGKFKELPRRNSTKKTKQRDDYKDFELKEGQIRIYLFEDKSSGLIVVMGEFKKNTSDQSATIDKMRQIKMAYFEEKESLETEKKGKIKIQIEKPED
jgi:hypothetical protein